MEYSVQELEKKFYLGKSRNSLDTCNGVSYYFNNLFITFN